MEYFSKSRTVPKATVEVRISGISNSYPPEISAMRKMAISGAFMMLPITPAMPARVKFMTDRSSPRKV